MHVEKLPIWQPATGLESINRLSTRALRLVLYHRLRGWHHGHLRVLLPDGERLDIGDAQSTDRATVSVARLRLFADMLLRGEMGVGESFVRGDWNSDNLVALLRLFVRNLDSLALESPVTRWMRTPDRLRHLSRPNHRRGSRRNIRAHYDLGNDFYGLFLGESRVYSCAYFAAPNDSLEVAQHRKIDRVCEGLDLQPTDHLLEIGCGWGEFAIRAVQRHGCRVTGITVSKEQADLARQRVRAAGLDHRIDIRLCDYRDVSGTFDKIASIEMIEGVGEQYLDAFFSCCRRRLRQGGKLAIQTIHMPEERFASYRRSVDWTQTYIFPGSLIPSLSTVLGAAARGGRFRLASADEIGPHYEDTLRHWRQRLNDNRRRVFDLGFGRSFWRTWQLYLSFSEASFAERSLGDAQLVFTGDDDASQIR